MVGLNARYKETRFDALTLPVAWLLGSVSLLAEQVVLLHSVWYCIRVISQQGGQVSLDKGDNSQDITSLAIVMEDQGMIFP
jgi:hypothetical protein